MTVKAKLQSGRPGGPSLAVSRFREPQLEVNSGADFQRHCVGRTSDLEIRLAEHTAGKSTYTQRYMPWNLVCYLRFTGRKKAIVFEKYLKAGAGKIFLHRHVLSASLARIAPRRVASTCANFC